VSRSFPSIHYSAARGRPALRMSRRRCRRCRRCRSRWTEQKCSPRPTARNRARRARSFRPVPPLTMIGRAKRWSQRQGASRCRGLGRDVVTGATAPATPRQRRRRPTDPRGYIVSTRRSIRRAFGSTARPQRVYTSQFGKSDVAILTHTFTRTRNRGERARIRRVKRDAQTVKHCRRCSDDGDHSRKTSPSTAQPSNRTGV